LLRLARLFRLIVLAFFTASSISLAQDCLSTELPIGETELMDVGKRWKGATNPSEDFRVRYFTACGYVDSTGAIPSGIKVKELFRCPLGSEAPPDTLVALYFKGKEGDKDESLYLVVMRDTAVIAQSMVAQLLTSCDATYLSGCSLQPDGTILVQALKHTFDCDTDAFIETTKLPSFGLRIREDHTFELILNDAAQGDGE